MVTYNESDHSYDENRIWKALADGKRRMILDRLLDGAHSTGELVNLFPTIGRTGVLKHIGVLEQAQLIQVERKGRVRLNHVNEEAIDLVCSPFIERHRKAVRSSMEHLKALAEDSTKSK